MQLGTGQLSYEIKDLDPLVNFTIYLSAITCHGEGVRSLPLYVYTDPTAKVVSPNSVSSPSYLESYNMYPNFKNGHRFRKIMYDGKSFSDSLLLFDIKEKFDDLHSISIGEKLSLTREPWFIVSAVMFSLLWILICLGLVFCGRYRSGRLRRRNGALDPMDVGMIKKNGVNFTDSNSMANGRSAMYMENHSMPNEVSSFMEPLTVNPILMSDNFEKNNLYSPGFTNEISHLLNASVSGPVLNNYSMHCNGNLHPYIKQYPVNAHLSSMNALNNTAYATSNMFNHIQNQQSTSFLRCND